MHIWVRWSEPALVKCLKRMKNPVDKETDNDGRYYEGENHLVGIESFHGKCGLIFFIQSKCSMKNTNCKFGILFFNDTGNPDFRSADHHNVDVFPGQGAEHH